MGSLASWEAAGFLASVAVAAVLGGGKLTILAGAVDEAPVGAWPLAGLLVYIDLAWALIVIAGLHQLYRVPGLGRRIRRARDTGARVLRANPWMHRLAWIGLVGFVAVPFNGTGSVVGAILGRLLGLTRWGIVTAVGIGSALGSAALAALGDLWGDRISGLADQPLLGVAVFALVIGLTAVISHWATREHPTA